MPRTLSGKPLEVPVKRILMGARAEDVVDRSSIGNAQALDEVIAAALRYASGQRASAAPVRSPVEGAK